MAAAAMLWHERVGLYLPRGTCVTSILLINIAVAPVAAFAGGLVGRRPT